MIITARIFLFIQRYYFFQTYWLNLPDFQLMQLDFFSV